MVTEMTRTLYDPEVEKRGVLKTAKNGIIKGYPLEMIADMTGLSIEEINDLQKELKK